jgi:hypothetical protein
MDLKLSSEERQLLAEVLQQYQRELLLEISHAAHQQFKNTLRARERLVEKLLDKLEVPATAAN